MRPLLAALALAAAALAQAPATDPDSDGDGLSDFHERHKHLTDPAKPDSDGDNVPDGEWRERREFTYTVRTLVQVMRPVTPDVLCDDWQDARILDEAPAYVELEVVHYPFGTAAATLHGDPQWRERASTMKEWLAPGPTADWDDDLRRRLRADLGSAGIDPATLDDKALVEQASARVLRRAECVDGFTTFYTAFEGGKPVVPPELRGVVDEECRKSGRAVRGQWERELSARGMYQSRCRGSCSSSAIYLAGCLRALGIPTRIVFCIPAIDASDEREMTMARKGLAHHEVRRTLLSAAEVMGSSWSSHTFNEVFVGGRWRRLNYDRLGQGILDENYLGLMTHVATFNDWADAKMPESIGRRQGLGLKDDVFGYSNAYSTLGISDCFGKHGRTANDPVAEPADLGSLTIASAFWYQSGGRPAGVEMRLDDPETAGHVLVSVNGDATFEAVSRFYERVPKAFLLKARGRADVPLQASRGFWWNPSAGVRVFYLRIEPADLSKMVPGCEYRLDVPDPGESARWIAGPEVVLTRTAR